MGGNCDFFWFLSRGCLFLGYKQILNGSMGGLGKWGKIKMVQKRAEIYRKVDISKQKRALFVQKVAEI